MMKTENSRTLQSSEQAKIWRLEEVGNIEMLHFTYSKHSYPRHWHDTFVIQVIENGVNEFYNVGRTYTAHTKSLCFINPQDVHTGRSVGTVPLTYRSIYPSPECIIDVALQIGFSGEVPMFASSVIENAPLAEKFLQMHRILEQPHIGLLAVESLLTQTLAELLLHCSANPPRLTAATREKNIVRLAKEYMMENLHTNISLQELSLLSGVSVFHFLRMFERTIGLPPYMFLTNLRVLKAKEMLRTGESIAQVALQTGFYDQSHFHRHFKKIVGVTPRHFVKQ